MNPHHGRMSKCYTGEERVARVGFYVDGFNLYHAMAENCVPQVKWLNLKGLAESFLRPGDTLEVVCYFTAVQHHNPVKATRHRKYIDALRAVGVEVVDSNFQKVSKYCRDNDRNCRFVEEKRTDVALATRYLLDAIQGVVDRVILVTADSDQIPAVTALQVHRPEIELTLAIPVGRRKQCRELSSLFITRPIELTQGRLLANPLPVDVYGPDGRKAASCPAEYLPAR